MKWLKKDIYNKLATLGGVAMAIANAWITIDWANFDKSKDLPKLFLSAFIAAGGYLSSFNKPTQPTN